MEFIYFLFFLINPLFGSSEIRYTLSDLSVLERENNFGEFLAHANDIRPSERQKLWKDMYQSMALLMVEDKLKKKKFDRDTYKTIEEIAQTNAMSDDPFFQLKRNLYAKRFFTECYKDKNKIKICDNELQSFWLFSKKDPDLGLDLAKIVEEAGSSFETWPFYSTAINDSVAVLYCQRPPVRNAIFRQLAKESFAPQFDGNYSQLIKHLVHEKCFTQIIPALKTSIEGEETNGLEKELAMNILSSQKALTDDEENYFSVLYLLSGPVVGEKMNVAWRRIENLSENYKKRQLIIEKIKQLEFIPEKIFKDPQGARNKAIIALFAKSFPEYLNFYGESCIRYLEKKGAEPPNNIRSSLTCTQFLKTAKDVNWISESLQLKFSALKKD